MSKNWFVDINGERVPKANETNYEEMFKLLDEFGDNFIMLNENMTEEEIIAIKQKMQNLGIDFSGN